MMGVTKSSSGYGLNSRIILRILSSRERVAAKIDNQETILKFIMHTPDKMFFIPPANSSIEAMHFHPSQISIQRLLVGQMRSYR
jgi:SOS-response transcriptional repressor LexA